MSLIKIYIHNLRIHCMLSKKEREYLSGKLNLSNNYQRKIEHSIRKKLGVFRELELPLLRRSEVIGGEASYLGKLTSCQSGLTPRKETRLFLTKNHNGITKFGNAAGISGSCSTTLGTKFYLFFFVFFLNLLAANGIIMPSDPITASKIIVK